MSQPSSNGFDPIAKHVEAFEAVDAELEVMKMRYMNECRTKREEQKRIVKMVKAEGFASDAFKAVIKCRRLEKKIEAIADDLEDDDAIESYEQMMEALGGLADLPLGQAAVEATPKKSKREAKVDADRAAVDSLVSDNVVKIESGIKPLH